MRESLKDVYIELVSALEDGKIDVDSFITFFNAINKLSIDITEKLGE